VRLDGVRVLTVGAGGMHGTGLIEALEARGAVPVRVSSRRNRVRAWTEAGLGGVLADLRSAESIRRAARGAQAAVVHVPASLAAVRRTPLVLAALRALREAGLAVVVNLGAPVPLVGTPDPAGRRQLEERATAEGVTVLAPTAYLENHAAPWMLRSLLEGELLYPRPFGDSVAWLTARDVNSAAVAALAGDITGETVSLAGPRALTFDQLVDEVGAGLGRPIRFRRVSALEYGDMLQPYLGDDAAASVTATYRAMPEEQNPLMVPGTAAAWARLHIVPTPAAEWSADHLTPLLAEERSRRPRPEIRYALSPAHDGGRPRAAPGSTLVASLLAFRRRLQTQLGEASNTGTPTTG
jgi:uncharacterized protein YbjT (DUF2867 family)